jgi:hypothetical protein
MSRLTGIGFALLAALVGAGTRDAGAAPLAGVSVAAGTPIGFNAAAGLGALTDGVVDDDDWLTAPWTSMGWLDANWKLNPAPPAVSFDSLVSQPLLTFNLGGTYLLNSVTVHYTVDHVASDPDPTRNLRAPDSMTATFSVTGAGGPFILPAVETAWNDSVDSNTTTPGVGSVRSLTTNLGGVLANAVRLDFRTDAEWLFMSEISFDGTRVVPEPASLGLLALAGVMVSLKGRRRGKPS